MALWVGGSTESMWTAERSLAGRLSLAGAAAVVVPRTPPWGAAQLLTAAKTSKLTLAMTLPLLLASGVLAAEGSASSQVVAWSSTNLYNLSHHPIAALVTSIFVLQGGLLPSLVSVAIACAVLEHTVGAKRTLAIGLSAHMLATLLTEYGGAMASRLHLIAAFSAERDDVGVSYVMYALLAAAAITQTGRLRHLAILVVGGAVLLPFALAPGMTTTGHVLSVAIGAVAVTLHRQPDRGLARSQPGTVMTPLHR